MKINQEYITALHAKIDAVEACEALQHLADEIGEYVNEQLAACNAELAKLRSLIVAPTDLPSVISWIQTVIGIANGGITTYIAMLSEYAAALASLVSALQAKVGGLSCTNVKLPGGQA